MKKRGCTRPNACGIASHFAIDSVVRAVGRIVVCVEAEADVSTQMISSLSSPEPSTPLPSAFSTSSELLARKLAPWYACAAALTAT